VSTGPAGRSWRDGASKDEMREIDRRAEQEYGLTPFLLMEVAGLAVARVARRLVEETTRGGRVAVLTGPGNNGGDGMVAARRLSAWGTQLEVITSYPLEDAKGLSRTQLEILEALGLDVHPWDGTLPSADLLVDALLGFGSSGEPRGWVAEMIDSANQSGLPILSVDVPSGLDCDSGEPAAVSVRARATVTLALPKIGMLVDEAQPYLGDLYLADIGIPPQLLAEIGIDGDGLFADDDIMALEEEDVAEVDLR